MKKHLLSILCAACITSVAMAHDPGAEPLIMVNPADGSVLTELSELTLTFNMKVQEDYPEGIKILKDGQEINDVAISFELAESLMEATATFTPTITEPGTYQIVNLDWAYVPSEIAGGVFPALNPTYTIVGESSNEVILDPADGSRVDQLDKIVITFPMPVLEDWTDAVKVLKNGQEYNGTSLSFSLADDQKTATVTFTPAITEEGYYKIQNLDYAYCGQDGTVFDPMNPQYIVGNPAKPEPIIISSPADGATVTRIDSFILYFENVETIECNSEIPATLTVDGSSEPLCTYTLTFDAYNNEIFLQPNVEDFSVSNPGTYTLTCPEGSFSLDGKLYSYTATIRIADKLVRPVVNPAEGDVISDDLKTITFTFKENVVIESITQYMIPSAKLSKLENGEDGEYYGDTVATYKVVVDAEHPNVLRYEAETFNITETGTYALQLPPTLIVSNLGKNEAWSFDYNVTQIGSGVETINSDSNFDVYSIDGRCVIKAASGVDYSTLNRGIYIVNGKKIIVK